MRPSKDDCFVVMGRGHQELFIHFVKHPVVKRDKGFTPHLIENIKFYRETGIVKIGLIGAMHGCGVKVEEDKKKYKVFIIDRTETEIPLATWNKLVDFTHTNYELD